jgi:hypothetical protein
MIDKTLGLKRNIIIDSEAIITGKYTDLTRSLTISHYMTTFHKLSGAKPLEQSGAKPLDQRITKTTKR